MSPLLALPLDIRAELQLVHEATKKFMCVSPDTYVKEGKNSKIIVHTMELTSYNSRNTHFQVLPICIFQMVLKE